MSSIKELFRAVKESNSGRTLLFRFGNYYEAFFEDADLIAGLMNLNPCEENLGYDHIRINPEEASNLSIKYEVIEEA